VNATAEFRKQGWDPVQAAILAKIQPALTAELERTAQPEKKASPEVQALVDLVSLYETKFPEICYTKGGSRARKAMDYVLRGDVICAGVDRYGNDVWLVAGQKCSKRGNWCDCKDVGAPTILNYGKLCFHRLAIALKTNWKGDKNPALLAYLQKITEDTRGAYVDILIERDYDYHGEGNRARVAGYWCHGMSQHERLVPQDVIAATLPQFQWAFGEMGWGLADLPMKLPGTTDYYYRIAKGSDLLLSESIFWHRGRTWRMEDRERMRRLQLVELAAHLEEWINAPISIPLNNYEARRITELRQRMKEESMQAAEVWAALPEALQAAFLENGENDNAY